MRAEGAVEAGRGVRQQAQNLFLKCSLPGTNRGVQPAPPRSSGFAA